MTTGNINNAAQAALDAARQKSGQFGEQAHAHPGTDVVTDASHTPDGEEAVASAVASGMTEENARLAVNEVGPFNVAVWHMHNCKFDNAAGEAASYREQAERLNRFATENAVEAGVYRILRAYPNATKIVVADDDEGGSYWTAEVDGEEADMDAMSDDLWDIGCAMDMRRAHYFEKWCVGNGTAPSGEYASGLTIDRRSGRLSGADIDLSLFR